MRKELSVRLHAEWVLPLREKEVSAADCERIQWSGMSKADPWGSQDQIVRIHAFEEFAPELDAMAREIQRLSGSRMTSAEEVQVLGSFLDQVRFMASEVERSAAYREGTSPELCDRNRELETMVWVLRKDLDQIAIRACA